MHSPNFGHLDGGRRSSCGAQPKRESSACHAPTNESSPLVGSHHVRTINWDTTGKKTAPARDLDQQAGCADWLLAKPHDGSLILPKQSAGHKYLKYLIYFPIWQLLSLAWFAIYVVPLVQESLVGPVENMVMHIIDTPVLLFLAVFGIVAGLAHDIGKDIVTFALLRRGLQRVTLPSTRKRLIHAVVICEYKEPYDVLAETIRSLKDQTLAHNTIVVIAQEARDPEADKTFQRLLKLANGTFRDFVCTRHSLLDGEVAGKSSNENHAVRELYKRVEKEGVDPYEVMVTVADADSHFDYVFLEQLESQFCSLPDGRHTLFDSPINTYRNLPECDTIVQHFEISRSQFCTFTHMEFQPCQSNYSLTLGFAHTIDYWDGDNTSEDMHTTMKAMAFNNAALNSVVTVWSLILNDSVAGFSDRWTQAKRHMWGIEETAWVIALFPVLRFRVWARLFKIACGALLTTNVVPPWLICVFPSTIRLFLGLNRLTQMLLIASVAFGFIYSWIKVFIREVYMHKVILAGRKEHMQSLSYCRWLYLFFTYPVLIPLSHVIFNTLATWRMLIHAMRNVGLKYVTAPKEFKGCCDKQV